jgi:hypothetical protein
MEERPGKVTNGIRSWWSREDRVVCGHVKYWAKNGETCRLPAGFGTPHPGAGACKYHGGATEAGQKNASVSRVRHETLLFAAGKLQSNPLQELLSEVERSAYQVHFLELKLLQIQEDGGEDALFEQYGRPGPWLAAFERERRHLVHVSEVCCRLGLAERQVRLAEAQGRLTARALELALHRLGLPEDSLSRAPGVLRAALAQVQEEERARFAKTAGLPTPRKLESGEYVSMSQRSERRSAS